jgi:predicted nuclease of predicted toxin-antitoxin system
MRFLLDSNMPRSALAVFGHFGHEAVFARDIGLAAASDEDIAARARSMGAVLLTRDVDFGDVRRYPPDEYCGIVVLRLPDKMGAGQILRVLERFLRECAFVDPLPGRLAIVELDRARFRPPLPV